MSQFTLGYKCRACGTFIPIYEKNKKVLPPPDFCTHCGAGRDFLGPKRKLLPGTIIRGLKLVEYYRKTQSWKCLCLYCKNICLVRNTNIKNQQSCGCLRSNSLKIDYYYDVVYKDDFTVIDARVRCTCKDCHLESDYDLLSDNPIICEIGCGDERMRKYISDGSEEGLSISTDFIDEDLYEE